MERIELLTDPIEQRFDCSSQGTDFAFHPDGDTVALAHNCLDIIQLSPQTTIAQPESFASFVRLAAFSSDGRHFATGQADGTIAFRGINDVHPIRRFVSGNEPISLTFLSHYGLLAVNNSEQTRKWIFIDVATARQVPPPAVFDLERNKYYWSPDATCYAVMLGDGTLEMWRNERRLWSVATMGQVSDDLIFSHDSRQMAACRFDGAIQVWSVNDPQPTITFVGQSGRRPMLAFSPDGRTLAGLLREGDIHFWNIATGRELFTLNTNLSNPTRIKISPWANTIAVSGDNQVGQTVLAVWHLPKE